MLRRFSRPRGRFRWPTPGLLRIELLGGLVVGLALIPEAISFSVIAGVDPKVACSPPARWR
jgi:SulP family sulfate permease